MVHQKCLLNQLHLLPYSYVLIRCSSRSSVQHFSGHFSTSSPSSRRPHSPVRWSSDHLAADDRKLQQVSWSCRPVRSQPGLCTIFTTVTALICRNLVRDPFCGVAMLVNRNGSFISTLWGIWVELVIIPEHSGVRCEVIWLTAEAEWSQQTCRQIFSKSQRNMETI